MAQNGDSQLPKQHSNADNMENHATLPSKQLLYSEKFEDNSLKILNGDNKNPKMPQKTFKLPPSSILGQVKNFLPKMMEANHKLEEKLQTDPENLDIENVEDSEQYIEMNLAVVEDGDSSDSDLESDSEDSDSEDSDSSDCDIETEKPQDNSIKLFPGSGKSKKAKIEILVDKDKKNMDNEKS